MPRVWTLLILLAAMFWPRTAAYCQAATQDGLKLRLDATGRVLSLSIQGHELAAHGPSGGFLLRAYPAATPRQMKGEVSSDGRTSQFRGKWADAGLALQARIQPRPDHIALDGRVVDERKTGDRAVDVVFRVPFDPPGRAQWWPDIMGPRTETGKTIKLGRLGSPQTVLSFAPVKARRFRLYQPESGGCAKRPGMMWVAEIEAYGRDLNENLLQSNRLAAVRCDSSSGKYSIRRVHDRVRNDRWDKSWLRRGWASDNSDKPHWIEAEFAEDVELARLDVYWSRERFGFATSRQFRLERWDGQRWRRVDAAMSHEKPRLGDAEKAQFVSADPGQSTDSYPLACVTDADQRLGIGMAIPPDSPCVFQLEYDEEAKCLALTLKFGLSALPRNPQLKSQAPFRFVLFRVDARWGFRDAARRYYAMFPERFARVAKLDGLWMLGNPTRIPNPHHYAYREHGEKEADLDELWGIYTCPYVLVGQREFLSSTSDYDAAMAELRRLDPSLRGYYGPGLRELIENCSLRHANGRHVTLFRSRGGSHDGPGVVTFPMNPDPSLYEGTDRKTVAKNTLAHVAGILAAYPKVDGIYVDSLSSWGGYRNARREHFEFVDLPLTHDAQGHVLIDNALAHIEFLRALRKQMPSRGKIIFGNGIRKRRAWAGFACDVCGVEANRSVYRDASHYAFFRTIAYHKPFLLLYYYNYPKMDLPRPAVEEYVQSAVAFGIAPETRPFGKERTRDLDLYNAFIPILRKLGQAGWEPVTHADATDNAIWLERFGTGPKGLFFTVYNPATEAKTVKVTVDFDALAYGAGLPAVELVTGRQMPSTQVAKLDLPAKSLRVLQIGEAPQPPTPPVLSPDAVVHKLLVLRETKWKDAGSLLKNGGFELSRGKGLLGWRMRAKGAAEIRIDTREPHSGKQCLYFRDDDKESWADLSQTFPYIQADREYVLRLWVKHPPGRKHPGRVYFQWRGDKGKLAQGRHDFRRAEEWALCEWRMTPPAGARLLGLSFGCAKRDRAELWLDDVCLVRRPKR